MEGKPKPKPKPWHSFERHREWQDDNVRADDGDAQKIIGEIVEAAGRAVKDSRWWEAAKSVVEGVGGDKEQPSKKAGRSKGSR